MYGFVVMVVYSTASIVKPVKPVTDLHEWSQKSCK